MTWYLWMFLFLVFLGIEIVTTGVFFFLCFSTGALFAMMFSLLGFNFQICAIVFCAVSVLSILLIRPLLKMYIAKKKIDTNIDSLIGAPALVIEDIKIGKTGKIKVGGEIWLAVCKNESVSAGETVVIQSVDGTKLVVIKNK